MLNSYPEWQNFQFTPNNHYGFVFLHIFSSTITFKLLHALFCQYYAEISIFTVKKSLVRLQTSETDVGTFGRKWCQILTWRQKDTQTSCTSVILYPPPPPTFLSEGSTWLTACMSEQRRFWRDCADVQACLNPRCSHRRQVPNSLDAALL